MFSFRDLFQWERFVTPSIIKLFFWLAVAIIILFGLSGIASALQMMATSAGVGVFMLLGSLLGVTIGILFARIVAEFVLIVFRINEHLGAIRNRGELVGAAMSRAFVKEDDSGGIEPLPDRPVSPHPNIVTPEGLAAHRPNSCGFAGTPRRGACKPKTARRKPPSHAICATGARGAPALRWSSRRIRRRRSPSAPR